jgi:AraC-like DNA-binding protein
VSGNLTLFAIYFYPHGLSIFLDLPLNELYNQSIPLRFILKDAASKLEDELSGVESFDQRISIAERFLITQIRKNEIKHQYNRIRHTVNLINQTKGVIDIEDLASHSCLSRKQYERIFSDIIGTSPKQFLKIVRFQNVIYQKSKHPDLSLTELAYQCGYYDQAHMINDFKTLSGYTPKQYFGDCEPFSDYFE